MLCDGALKERAAKAARATVAQTEVPTGLPMARSPPDLQVRHEKPGTGLRCVDTYALYTQVGACGLTHMGVTVVVRDSTYC